VRNEKNNVNLCDGLESNPGFGIRILQNC